MATAGSDKVVKLWDLDRGKERMTLKGHKLEVQDVAFSPDGKQVASCAGDAGRATQPGEIKLWRTEGGKDLQTLKGPKGGIYNVCYRPDGKQVAGCSFDNAVTIWDTQSGKVALTYKGQKAPLWCVAWSPDGKHLASSGYGELHQDLGGRHGQGRCQLQEDLEEPDDQRHHLEPGLKTHCQFLLAGKTGYLRRREGQGGAGPEGEDQQHAQAGLQPGRQTSGLSVE